MYWHRVGSRPGASVCVSGRTRAGVGMACRHDLLVVLGAKPSARIWGQMLLSAARSFGANAIMSCSYLGANVIYLIRRHVSHQLLAAWGQMPSSARIWGQMPSSATRRFGGNAIIGCSYSGPNTIHLMRRHSRIVAPASPATRRWRAQSNEWCDSRRRSSALLGGLRLSSSYASSRSEAARRRRPSKTVRRSASTLARLSRRRVPGACSWLSKTSILSSAQTTL